MKLLMRGREAMEGDSPSLGNQLLACQNMLKRRSALEHRI